MQIYFYWQRVDSYQLGLVNWKKRFSLITFLESICFHRIFLKERLQYYLSENEKKIIYEKWSNLGYTDALTI